MADVVKSDIKNLPYLSRRFDVNVL